MADASMVAGLRAVVRKGSAPGASPEKSGIACSAAFCPAHGTPLLEIAVVHEDGTALTAYLDRAKAARLGAMVALFTSTAGAIQ